MLQGSVMDKEKGNYKLITILLLDQSNHLIKITGRKLSVWLGKRNIRGQAKIRWSSVSILVGRDRKP